MQTSLADYFLLISDFFHFWFWRAPQAMIDYFGSLNNALLKLLSLRLLVITFFKPWKNEYRQGLVGFSIGIGIFIKSIVIAFDSAIFLLFLLVELLLLCFFFSIPILTIVLVFK